MTKAHDSHYAQTVEMLRMQSGAWPRWRRQRNEIGDRAYAHMMVEAAFGPCFEATEAELSVFVDALSDAELSEMLTEDGD